jgi:hypothetical protein
MSFTHLQIEWNPLLGGYRPQISVLSSLSSTEFVDPPPPKKFWVRHWKTVKYQNHKKIRPVGVELFHTDGQTGWNDEANIRNFATLRTSLKIESFLVATSHQDAPNVAPERRGFKQWSEFPRLSTSTDFLTSSILQGNDTKACTRPTAHSFQFITAWMPECRILKWFWRMIKGVVK